MPTLILAIVAPLLDTLAISLYGRLVDDILVPRQLALLVPIAAAYVGLTLLGGLIDFGRTYGSAWITEHLLCDLRNQVFRHLQGLPLEFFERSRLGDTVSRVTDDVDELGDFLVFRSGRRHGRLLQDRLLRRGAALSRRPARPGCVGRAPPLPESSPAASRTGSSNCAGSSGRDICN